MGSGSTQAPPGVFARENWGWPRVIGMFSTIPLVFAHTWGMPDDDEAAEAVPDESVCVCVNR